MANHRPTVTTMGRFTLTEDKWQKSPRRVNISNAEGKHVAKAHKFPYDAGYMLSRADALWVLTRDGGGQTRHKSIQEAVSTLEAEGR